MLKKANEISGDKSQPTVAAEKSAAPPPMEIPVVNVPDYPDRTPRRGPFKVQGPNIQLNKQGLTAPTMTDMSSSGPN